VQRADGTTGNDGGLCSTCGGPSRPGRHSDITVKGAVELGYPRKRNVSTSSTGESLRVVIRRAAAPIVR
jgi:hypothetical protein